MLNIRSVEDLEKQGYVFSRRVGDLSLFTKIQGKKVFTAAWNRLIDRAVVTEEVFTGKAKAQPDLSDWIPV